MTQKRPYVRNRQGLLADPVKQREFLDEVASGSPVKDALADVWDEGMRYRELARFRRGDPGFDQAVRESIELGRSARAELLEDRILTWAANGVPRPLVFRGQVTDADHREIDAALSWRVLQSLRRDVYGNHVNVNVQHELTVFVDPLERRARLLELERQHPELAERAGVLPVLTLDEGDVVEDFEVAR